MIDPGNPARKLPLTQCPASQYAASPPLSGPGMSLLCLRLLRAPPQVPNVALGGCRCLKSLVTAFGAGAGQRDVGAVVGELAPLLVELAGDSNPRLSSSGSELIVFLAPENVCGLQTLVRTSGARPAPP